uniref:DUF2188 domain-containing protein n=1 Tax=Steinernema glaseri TaxID=37863 RepID=A0A1I8ALH4_9BILA
MVATHVEGRRRRARQTAASAATHRAGKAARHWPRRAPVDTEPAKRRFTRSRIFSFEESTHVVLANGKQRARVVTPREARHAKVVLESRRSRAGKHSIQEPKHKRGDAGLLPKKLGTRLQAAQRLMHF